MNFNQVGVEMRLNFLQYFSSFITREKFSPSIDLFFLSILWKLKTNICGRGKSAFIFINFWRVKFLSFFICSREPKTDFKIFCFCNSMLRFIRIHFDGTRIASVRENLSRMTLLLRGEFRPSVHQRFLLDTISWRNALQEADPCLDRSLSEHRSILWCSFSNITKELHRMAKIFGAFPNQDIIFEQHVGKFSHLNDGNGADST